MGPHNHLKSKISLHGAATIRVAGSRQSGSAGADRARITPGCRSEQELSASCNQRAIPSRSRVRARAVARRRARHVQRPMCSGRRATTAAGHQRPSSCIASAARSIPARASAQQPPSRATSPAAAPGTAYWAAGSTPARVTHGGVGVACGTVHCQCAAPRSVQSRARGGRRARRLDGRPVGHAELDREELLQLMDLGQGRDDDVLVRQRRYPRLQRVAQEQEAHLRTARAGPGSRVWPRGGQPSPSPVCPRAES